LLASALVFVHSDNVMNKSELRRALGIAVKAAQAAGTLMRKNLRQTKRVNRQTSHDIKLELDVRCQKLIERMLHAAFPDIALLGEEGDSGAANAAARWVVDPIDGTVNFAYGIPHACVSIALQVQSPTPGIRAAKPRITRRGAAPPNYLTVVGVVYDPFTDELWTVIRGEPARLNGRIIHVSSRQHLRDAIVSIGFSKSRYSTAKTLPYFNWLVMRVRKVRMLGAAALGLTYVATARLDAYIERGINLWDVAAGGLILECAGGTFWCEPIPGRRKFRMVASNSHLHKKLPPPR
jgi:myo-inositol-1(or 4)-monophosphatase